MNQPLHKTLADGRFGTFSLAFQLGNVGSEIGRAISWSRRGNVELRDRALERGLELFDLVLGDERWRHRSKEIARAREVVCDYFYGGNSYRSTGESLEKYFLEFGMAARRESERMRVT